MDPRVAKARRSLVMDRRYRFFATLLMMFKIVEDPTCKTFWVDGISLGYNPAYLGMLDDDELKGVLAHETLHPALGHIFRMEGRDPDIANRAADYPINLYVLASGLKLPKGVLIDPSYNGSLEENYARLMREREQEQKKQSAPQQQQQKGSRQAQGAGQGQDQQQGRDQGQATPASGQKRDQTGVADNRADGQGEPQHGEFDPGCGEVRPYPGEHAANAEAKWKVAVMQAAKAARMVGQAPGWLEGALQGIAEPAVEWRSLLMRFAQDAASTDYTFARPNRRYLHMGMYLPSLHAPALEDAVFVRDSSGSLWSETQAQFDAEIVNVYETLQPRRLVVMDCDTAVSQVQIFERGDPIELKPVRGGGGTSFVAPFIRVGEEAITPAFLVYLTDMEGTFPADDPGYPVLWASTTKLDRARVAPFGETIEVIV
ncbi:vWA domain-containing protein [Paraburkholderia aromaticivorans]|uniref:vWA domain-containing protein n=1 Tax=Paraburkholderia aromaticivorans TaxID=2026199 RepID=UPI00145622B7|nr:VWA-like domain-containing protein [Paraburkholderia aromaticivorans]